MVELPKIIADFPNYEIYPDKRIKNLLSGKFLKGKQQVNLKKNGKHFTRQINAIHREMFPEMYEKDIRTIASQLDFSGANKLRSFENDKQAYTFLTYTKTFEAFLKGIRSVEGCSLHILEDFASVVRFKGIDILTTKKHRFESPEQLNALLKIAGLQ